MSPSATPPTITLSTIFLWFVIYSIIGWLIETTLCSIAAKKFVNRGFLNGPYCPIYGFGALLIIAVLGDIDNVLVLFLAGMALTCTLEYITSWLMEKVFHARWWDYSEKPFNLNGRVCLSNAIGFGLLSVLLVKLVHPVVALFVASIPPLALPHLVLFVAVCLFFDVIYTIARFSKFNTKLATPFPEVFQWINDQERRLIKAFPNFQAAKNNDTVHEIRHQAMQKKPKTTKKAKPSSGRKSTPADSQNQVYYR